MKNYASSKNRVFEEYLRTWKDTGMQYVYHVKSKSEYEAGQGFAGVEIYPGGKGE